MLNNEWAPNMHVCLWGIWMGVGASSVFVLDTRCCEIKKQKLKKKSKGMQGLQVPYGFTRF